MNRNSEPTGSDIANMLSGFRIVSVTPNALRSDSRTLKQAATIARAGAESIVIEGFDSGRSFSSLNIQVSSVEGSPTAVIASQVTPENAKQPARSFRRTIRSLIPEWILEVRQFVQVIIGLTRQHWLPVYRMLPDADVYILHSMSFWPAIWMKTKLTRTRYIYDAHDFYRGMTRATAVDGFTRRWMLPLYAWLDRAAVRSASSMMTVSEGVVSLYEKAEGVSPYLLRNGHDLRTDSAVSKGLRDVLQVPSDVFLIVAIGNAKTGSSIAKLIEVVASLDEKIHIAFVGKNFESEKAIDRPLEVRCKVHFVDAVSADQVVPFIASADCAIIVYFGETENHEAALPNRFFQSIAAALPLIYPQLSEMHALASSVPAGISFAPDNSSEMKAAILRVFRDAEFRSVLRTQAIAAREKLSWNSEEPGFVRLIRSAIAAKGVKRA